VQKPSTGRNHANGANCRMVKGAPAPNRLGTWAYDHVTLRELKRWLTRYNHVTPAPVVGICKCKNHGLSKPHAPNNRAHIHNGRAMVQTPPRNGIYIIYKIQYNSRANCSGYNICVGSYVNQTTAGWGQAPTRPPTICTIM
jgi:hypothetical protein